MTWFKVDDSLAFHHKAVAAGNAALGLWVRAGSWSAQQLTDGFVPEAIALMLGTAAQTARLVRSGLWTTAEGGFQFHQWAENGRQPTRKEILERRKKEAEKKAKARASKPATWQAKEDCPPGTDSGLPEGHPSGLPEGVRATRPVPSRPEEKKKTSSSSSRKRGERIPVDFAVTPAMIEWAREHAANVDGRHETANFVDYWTAKSGQAATKLDWTATWRTWMRNAQQRAGNAKPARHRPNADDTIRQLLGGHAVNGSNVLQLPRGGS